MNFESLRNMGPFSEDMFNRIIAFQEKEHPAWRTDLPFEQRIKGLPLHYLIFSNPDRDPERYGPTVAPYYPLREEMVKIAAYARAVAEKPIVCDLHAGNGFVGSLLAREGLSVVGLRDPKSKPNQIRDFYDKHIYTLSEIPVEQIDFPFDVAFSSWMPANINHTPEILRHQPKLIVFVHTEHRDESTGRHQTGTPDAYLGLPDRYKLIEEWSVTRPADLLHEIWPDITPSIEETRYVKIYADAPYHGLSLTRAEITQPYDWEAELEMASLALEAKQNLRAMGMPV